MSVLWRIDVINSHRFTHVSFTSSASKQSRLVKEFRREAASQEGSDYFHGEKLIWHQPAVALMPLWFFFLRIHRSGDSECFSVDGTTPKIVLSGWWIWTPSNTWFIGLTAPCKSASTMRISHANAISISSAVFAGLTKWPTNRHTNRPRYSVCSNRPHLATAATWPKNGQSYLLV